VRAQGEQGDYGDVRRAEAARYEHSQARVSASSYWWPYGSREEYEEAELEELGTEVPDRAWPS
jgi:hypothetical protein